MLQCSIDMLQAIVLSGIAFPLPFARNGCKKIMALSPMAAAGTGAPAFAKGRFHAYDRLNIVRRGRSDKLRRQKKEIKIWIYWPSSAASTCPNYNA
jgi:hypothetical protein